MLNSKLGLFEKPTRIISKITHNGFDIKGVISESDLRSLIEIFCVDVKHAIIMYSLYDYNDKKEMIRVGSNVSTLSIHYCCEAFRICAGTKYCEQCDIEHANLFKGDNGPIHLSRMKDCVENNIKKYMNNEHKNSIYNNAEAPPPEFILWDNDKPENGGYLKYYCPILGYQEFIIPVVISGLVLGIIFRGQVPLEDNTISINIRKNFLKERPNLFDNYFSSYEIKDMQSEREKLKTLLFEGKDVYKEWSFPFTINKEIVKRHVEDGLLSRAWLKEKTSEDAIISSLQVALEKFTEELEKSMIKIRENYITNVVKEEAILFYSKLAALNVNNDAKKISMVNTKYKTDNNIKIYWKIVEQSLRRIVINLEIKNIQVYGSSIPHSKIESIRPLLMVAFACSNNCKINSKEYKQSLSFELYKEDTKINNPILSNKPLKIIKGLINEELSSRIICKSEDDSNIESNNCNIFHYKEKTNSNYLDILYFPVVKNLLHSTALVIEYFNDGIDNTELENSRHIKDMIFSIISLFSSFIFYISSSLLNDLLQSITETIMRFFNHELSHVIFGYNFLNKIYVQDLNNLKSLNKKELKDIQLDFEGTGGMFQSIPNNIKMLTKPTNEIFRDDIRVEEFKIFKEIFEKWKHLYRETIEEKNVDICISILDKNEKRPLIKSDKRLLEQMVLNIISNAIKYSHYGTNIIIDCKPYDEYSSKQVLTVIDYGVFIQKGKTPYGLFYRDFKFEHLTEGSGIGLFAVKRIAEILSIQISHSCEFISNYNVGLIEEYLSRESLKNDMDMYSKLSSERNLLIDKMGEENYTKMLNINGTNESELFDCDIKNLIKLKTYKVTFKAIINNLNLKVEDKK